MTFPSGPWTGFYNYGASVRRHRMDLTLTFADASVSGSGGDDVGRFVIAGHFDETTGECYWTKSYLGAHDVYYRGFREGKGIWGLWEEGLGGFHIWPVGEDEARFVSETVKEPVLVDTLAVETAEIAQACRELDLPPTGRGGVTSVSSSTAHDNQERDPAYGLRSGVGLVFGHYVVEDCASVAFCYRIL